MPDSVSSVFLRFIFPLQRSVILLPISENQFFHAVLQGYRRFLRQFPEIAQIPFRFRAWREFRLFVLPDGIFLSDEDVSVTSCELAHQYIFIRISAVGYHDPVGQILFYPV